MGLLPEQQDDDDPCAHEWERSWVQTDDFCGEHDGLYCPLCVTFVDLMLEPDPCGVADA